MCLLLYRGRGVSAGGLRGQMYEIGVQSRNRISFFFRPTPAFGHPPVVRAVRCHRPKFFAFNHLGPARRLDECRNRREKRPADKGRDMSFRRTLSGTMFKTNDTIWIVAPKRAQFQEHGLLSSDIFLNNVHFPGRFLEQCPISRRFLRQCPCCTTMSDAMFSEKPPFQPICFKP